MAIYTQLQQTSLPGKRHSFLAKTEAIPGAGPHTGLFTRLSVISLPGARHTFLAKTEAIPGAGPHDGDFTGLSLSALPGMRHYFLAKTAAEVIVVPVAQLHGGGAKKKEVPNYFAQALRDDEDLLQILAAAIPIIMR